MEKEKSINISILQMSSKIGDTEANCKKIKDIINRDLKNKTDLIVLPEVWPVGWSCSHFKDSAQELDNSSIIDFLSDIAKKHNTFIIGGSIILKKGDKYYNSCPVIDNNGKLIAIYSKMHLYSYYGCNEGKYITPGEYPIITEIKGVKFGLTICYDIRFPEIYREYAKAGADILINCAAWGAAKPIPWEVMTKSRAVENQCYMVALTQSGLIEGNNYNLGQSRIIDYKGEEVASIIEGEQLISTTLDIQEMYDFRAKSPTLADIRNSYEVKTLCVR